MTPELEDKLIKKYPNLFRDVEKSPRETCMCWGICFDDGWYDLFDELLGKLDKYDCVVLDQVKEKFGMMTVYYHLDDTYDIGILRRIFYAILHIPIEIERRVFKKYRIWRWASKGEVYNVIQDLTIEYGTRSYKICEMCGSPGKTTDSGWVKVLCDKCRAKWMDG